MVRNLIFCGAPLTAACGLYLTTIFPFSFKAGCYLTAIPVLFLFQLCFTIAEKFVPEIGDIFSALKNSAQFLGQEQAPLLKNKLKEIANRINAS